MKFMVQKSIITAESRICFMLNINKNEEEKCNPWNWMRQYTCQATMFNIVANFISLTQALQQAPLDCSISHAKGKLDSNQQGDIGNCFSLTSALNCAIEFHWVGRYYWYIKKIKKMDKLSVSPNS